MAAQRRAPQAMVAARRAYFAPVREAMRAQHVRHAELAQRIGVDPETMRSWLKGFYGAPDDFLRRVVVALDYPKPLVQHLLLATPPPRAKVGRPRKHPLPESKGATREEQPA